LGKALTRLSVLRKSFFYNNEATVINVQASKIMFCTYGLFPEIAMAGVGLDPCGALM